MKIGLVLEGGASRTYFSCGIMDALLEGEIHTDYVIGVSAGISYGVSYVSRQKGRNLEILQKYESTARYMGAHHLLNRKNRSFYNLDFVFGEIPCTLVPFDFNVFDNRKGNALAVVTNVTTGKPEYIEMPRDRDFMALRASCALPLLFQPVEIGGEKYMDGGITDSIPFGRALSDGCDKVIVLLTRPRGYVKEQESSIKLIKLAYGRNYPELVKAFLARPEMYNEQIKALGELERQGKALIISPSDTHGIKRTEKRVKILEPFYREGYEYGLSRLDAIKEFIE